MAKKSVKIENFETPESQKRISHKLWVSQHSSIHSVEKGKVYCHAISFFFFFFFFWRNFYDKCLSKIQNVCNYYKSNIRFYVKPILIWLHSVVEKSSKTRPLFLRKIQDSFVKSTVLLSKLLKSWFHRIFFSVIALYNIFPHCDFCQDLISRKIWQAEKFFHFHRFQLKVLACST